MEVQPVAAIFIKSNGRRVRGELCIDGEVGARRLMFRTLRADAFSVDELCRGSVLLYSDPNMPPTESV